jgi:hypothetical protein
MRCMFGHLLPTQLKLARSDDIAASAEADLVAVLQRLDVVARRCMLHGLVRPDAVLVGCYETESWVELYREPHVHEQADKLDDSS